MADVTGSDPIVQPEDDWLDTEGMRYLVLQTEAIMLSGATLVLQSSFTKEGPWAQIAAYAQAYTLQQVAISWEDNRAGGGQAPIARYIRWQLIGDPAEGDGMFWNACFRINGKWT